MPRGVLIGVAALLLVSCGPQASTQPATLTSLQSKLHGDWKGDGPCQGQIVFRTDGAYARTHYSPGDNECSGSWRVTSEALPPTLLLSCKTSNNPDLRGKTEELKLLRLDDAVLEYQHPGESSVRYTRASK